MSQVAGQQDAGAAGEVSSTTPTEAMSLPRQEARRVFVKVDMEGVSGVVSPRQLCPGNEEYAFARRMMMSDLQAVLEGAFAGGCPEAVVYDAHAEGLNVDLTDLDSRTVVVSGRPELQNGFFCGVHDTFSALFLVGFHARAGAPHALLPHTFGPEIAAVRLNGSELGEVGLEAALAGEFGVPLAFVSGDSATVHEGRELLGPDLEAVEVKKAVSPDSAICLPTSRTKRMLREAATRAVRKVGQLPPVVFQSPATLQIVYHRQQDADRMAEANGIEPAGERTVRTQGPTVLAAYKHFVHARQGIDPGTGPVSQPTPSS